jgi:hypothetical protein
MNERQPPQRRDQARLADACKFMLCVNSYEKHYIDECRSRMEAQLTASKDLVTAARAKTGGGKAVDGFESLFLGNLVVVLDAFFVHRARALEKKDGNALNEVRMICNSLLPNRGVLKEDKTIKYSAEKSVTKLKIGDEIKLTESAVVALSKAFFAEIQAKFM